MYSICVLLVLVSLGTAFPWDLPEPTKHIPAIDAWSPAPTKAPQLGIYELFRRQTSYDSTCGYVSGSSASSLTCSGGLICVNNTYNGNAGCCNQYDLTNCNLPTSCVASTDISRSCTNQACSTDPWVKKCTDSGLNECYTWFIEYQDQNTVMSSLGCTSSGFRSTAQRSFSGAGGSMSLTDGDKTVTTTVSGTASGTSQSPTLINPGNNDSNKPNIGAIVGGTVGGCVVLSVLAFGWFLWYRRRKNRRESRMIPAKPQRPTTHYHSHSMTEYKPGQHPVGEYPTAYVENDHKVQQPQHGPIHRMSDAMPQYPYMNQYGIVEVDGRQRPVEAPTVEMRHDGTIHHHQ